MPRFLYIAQRIDPAVYSFDFAEYLTNVSGHQFHKPFLDLLFEEFRINFFFFAFFLFFSFLLIKVAYLKHVTNVAGYYVQHSRSFEIQESNVQLLRGGSSSNGFSETVPVLLGLPLVIPPSEWTCFLPVCPFGNWRNVPLSSFNLY